LTGLTGLVGLRGGGGTLTHPSFDTTIGMIKFGNVFGYLFESIEKIQLSSITEKPGT